MKPNQLHSTTLTHIEYPSDIKWASDETLKQEKQLEEQFWKKFQELGWTSIMSGPKKHGKLGVGLYDQLKKSKSGMQTLSLRYFSVFLKQEDVPSHLINSNIVFNAAVRYCRDKKLGDSFSMCPQQGFKIENVDTFKVAKITSNGSDIIVGHLGEHEAELLLKKLIENGNVIEVFFLEDIKSVLK
jgi:hypothetical protein